MSETLLACATCKKHIPLESLALSQMTACPFCGAAFAAYVFPAAAAAPQVDAPASAIDGESTCFYHDARPAEHVCAACGRLICGLCDIELGSRHMCLKCFEQSFTEQKDLRLMGSRIRYDSAALVAAIVGPLLLMSCFPISAVAAVAAIVLAVMHFKKTPHRTLGSNTQAIAAIILASLELLGGAGFLLYFVYRAVSEIGGS